MINEKDIERFWSKVKRHESINRCWLWKGYRTHNGYGHFRLNNKTCKAHRISYIIYYGEIPEGLFILHKCDITHCVNPFHLEAGTLSKNQKDAWARGRREHTREISKKIGKIYGPKNRENLRKIGKKWGPINGRKMGEKWGSINGKVTRVLNEDQIREIFILRESGITYQEIANRFGVGYNTIRRVIKRETYADVKL